MAKAPTLSPMMQQYLDMKEKYPDTLLFFRLGDFYEMFFEDAKTASRELDLTLTGRDCGLPERAPMCGVPFHSVDVYVQRLLEKGYKIAICEQMEDPALAKGLVEREVIRVITPGTVIEASMLEEKSNNYILSLYGDEERVGIAWADVSTGEFCVKSLRLSEDPKALADEFVRLMPTEVMVPKSLLYWFTGDSQLRKLLGHDVETAEDEVWDPEEGAARLKTQFGWDPGKDPLDEETVRAAGALLEDLLSTQKIALKHINALTVEKGPEAMVLDASTRRNLELTQTLRGGSRRGTLLWVLDRTLTAMGGRLLRQYIEQPLQDMGAIKARLNAVEETMQDLPLQGDLRECLSHVRDVQRLTTKISYGTVNARDCLALRESMSVLPALKEKLSAYRKPLLRNIRSRIDTLEDLCALLTSSIRDDAPMVLRDGGFIKEGYDGELDRLHHAATHSRELISSMEASEREATGIRNLKIQYNRVFGYYIEVSRSFLDQVPDRYTRKQTLANAERFITQELKELEDTVLGAQEASVKLELRLFDEIREILSSRLLRLQKTARALAELDVILSLGKVAGENRYVKPEFADDGKIEILDGRHPVVECALKDERFVPNHTRMDGDDNRFLILTGPNMAGKSTYLRQTALITLMGHIGSFVPASSAKLCMVDRIFTRIGASDDLAMGQSTFMVEMTEVSAILRYATSRSLVILDEIGRGTSTFDGLSIAWAVAEYLCDRKHCGAKTLFATHYHELTALEGLVAGVRNYSVAVREEGKNVIFLRRVVRGGTDRSFGIHVARLAEFPEEVLERAEEILARLEEDQGHEKAFMGSAKEAAERINRAEDTKVRQMTLMGTQPYDDILEEIRKLDMTTTTPIDAFFLVNRLKEKMK